MDETSEIAAEIARRTADYLVIADNQLAYLDGCPREMRSNPEFIRAALYSLAFSLNASYVARRAGLTRGGLRKAVSRDGNPSFATVVRIADALGLELELRPKGHAA